MCGSISLPFYHAVSPHIPPSSPTPSPSCLLPNLLLLLPLLLIPSDCCLDPLPGCEGVTSRYYTILHEYEDRTIVNSTNSTTVTCSICICDKHLQPTRTHQVVNSRRQSNMLRVYRRRKKEIVASPTILSWKWVLHSKVLTSNFSRNCREWPAIKRQGTCIVDEKKTQSLASCILCCLLAYTLASHASSLLEAA